MNKLPKIQPRKYLKSESGQSVILISTVIISFILFFGFTVNTGLLVTAKISLQSAADAAAYAGAATQARQLNAISYLNYDMRRQFKKFLYRYNVVSSLANPDFANPSNPNIPGYYSFAKNEYFASPGDTTPRPNPINVPSLCIPLTSARRANDNCLMVNIPNTSAVFTGTGLSAISQQLYDNIIKIQTVQNQLCTGNSAINFMTLMQWLFKAEPTSNQIQQLFGSIAQTAGLSQADKDSASQTIGSLSTGLGLYPRNILTLLRMETLADFLNEPPVKEAKIDQTRAWAAAPDSGADQHERTIQAMESAIANLNETVMNPADVDLTELQAPQQIKINPVLASFNVYIHYLVPGSNTNPADKTPLCKVSIIPFPAMNVPVGMVRAQQPTTVHYAVKLRAKAHLMFLPIKDGLDLEAFAAAKPFGSRIGPSTLTEKDFVEDIQPGTVNGTVVNDCKGPLACKVPNLTLIADKTFYSSAYLNAMKTITHGSGPNDPATSQTLEAAARAAMAPNAAEIGHYNILPPPRQTQSSNGPDMRFEFIPFSDSNNQSVYRFYAPLFPASGGDPIQRTNKFIENVFGNQLTGQNAFGVDMDSIKNELKSQIGSYIRNNLQAAVNTENQESLTFAAIDLPMAGVLPDQSGKNQWLTDPNSVLTSWAPTYARVNALEFGFKARYGYSVKFVTLQNLLKNGMPSDDEDTTKVNH